MRLHRGGRFRAWLGARFGGDLELGNRLWRRILHGLGGAVLLYYLLPPNVLAGLPNAIIPLLALAAVLVLEGLRLSGHLEIPVIRPYESHRLASYAYFGLAMVIAVLAFPEPIAAAVILGTAIVDPLAGELRTSVRRRALYPYLPFVVYLALAWVALAGIGSYRALPAVFLSAVAAVLALAAEWPKWGAVDDDLAMTLLPGVVLAALVYFVLVLV